MSMEDGFAAFQGGSFGEQRRGNASGGGWTPKQSVVGQIIEYHVGSRASAASLKTDRVTVRLMHPVPAWGIEAPDDGGQYPVITVMQTKKPDARAYDLHAMKWGGKNANMAECDVGSLVLFENCFWVKEGRNFDGVSSPQGGMAVADYLTPYARPVELNGNPDKELPPMRYVFPYVAAMVMPGYVDKANPRNSSQKAVISLAGIDGAIALIREASGESDAIARCLEAAAPYGAFGNLGVLAIARKDLDKVPPESRMQVAEMKSSSYATDAWARRLRAAVTPDGTPYVVSCSYAGIERLQGLIGADALRETSFEVAAGARSATDMIKKRMLFEEKLCEPASRVGYFEIRVSPEKMEEVLAVVSGDMQVFAGPSVGRYEADGKVVVLGMPYFEGVRQVMSSLASKSSSGKTFGQTCADNGYTVELLPILEVRLLPSLTLGHPEKKSAGSLDVPHRIYDMAETINPTRTLQPGDVTLTDGRVAEMAGVGFAVAHLALSFTEKVEQWRIRNMKFASAGAVPVKPSEVLTPYTAAEYAQAYETQQRARQGVMKLVMEARYAPRPERVSAPDQGNEATPSL